MQQPRAALLALRKGEDYVVATILCCSGDFASGGNPSARTVRHCLAPPVSFFKAKILGKPASLLLQRFKMRARSFLRKKYVSHHDADPVWHSALVISIDGMARIERHAIGADRGIIAALLDDLLRAVVAGGASALELAQSEFGVVARDGARCDRRKLRARCGQRQAHLAQWL